MNPQQPKYKFILSGGGTGGHIFPAVAIADALKKEFPEASFHFVGALGRMEMQRIPEAGYTITGLPVAGFNRQQKLKNLSFPLKLLKSLLICRFLLKDRKPSVVIGTGGFASGPLLWMAQRKSIPTVIQEQNSLPGITNKLLGKKARAICVAYDGLEKYFPTPSIKKTGNPIREAVLKPLPEQTAAKKQFGLDPEKPVILVLGGSLGARAINNAVADQLNHLTANDTQLIWQCGKLYIEEYQHHKSGNIFVSAFIGDMNAAYAAADIIISRAGAGTISELCVVQKPTILVPSPNVAEDHQTHNARALSEKNAAILLPETKLNALHSTVENVLKDENKNAEMRQNMAQFAAPNATENIVEEIKKLL